MKVDLLLALQNKFIVDDPVHADRLSSSSPQNNLPLLFVHIITHMIVDCIQFYIIYTSGQFKAKRIKAKNKKSGR